MVTLAALVMHVSQVACVQAQNLSDVWSVRHQGELWGRWEPFFLISVENCAYEPIFRCPLIFTPVKGVLISGRIPITAPEYLSTQVLLSTQLLSGREQNTQAQLSGACCYSGSVE